ncbi:hypothetical protein LCGC14_1849060 [marine sediment metagenome]|uniref:Uncharacterized protein n=2 Tax=root TaxID=1 RepID=A0A831QR36_9FLAO|nr:hypothetical protein [Pricia antarctica]
MGIGVVWLFTDVKSSRIPSRFTTESDEKVYLFGITWKETMDYVFTHLSIMSQVPFNEAWAHFKTEEI